MKDPKHGLLTQNPILKKLKLKGELDHHLLYLFGELDHHLLYKLTCITFRDTRHECELFMRDTKF
jgi:hypothetical protein